MTDEPVDLLDTGPLEWGKPRFTIRELIPHAIIGACVVAILAMVVSGWSSW